MWIVLKSQSHELFFAQPVPFRRVPSGPSLEALDLWEKLHLCMSPALRLMSKHAEQRPPSCRTTGVGRGAFGGMAPMEELQAPGVKMVKMVRGGDHFAGQVL